MHRIRELYELYNQAVFRYFLRMTGNRDEAAELTQETFYQACLSVLRFRKQSSLKTWLYSIARNVYLKSLRNKGKPHALSPAESETFGFEPAGGDNPADVLILKEERDRVREALTRLPENYRSILILKEFEQMTNEEIAGIFDQTPNWVRVTFFRAKRQLGEIYRNLEGDDQC
ncbi:MAG: sigma-70 family RNA polymerase sigma factor [Clostridia bacterium]|jgi:RNA polymerase sigma-70 factor (ECF subfamily)|nr:sigma-70 family RNA polymerase sigma factor [Clostridia bacterium]